jgi:hypothetical protein
VPRERPGLVLGRLLRLLRFRRVSSGDAHAWRLPDVSSLVITRDARPDAPHDLSVPISAASDGTLYAGATCTTPLTSGTLTIPAGSSQVAFSPLPTTTGTSGFTVANVYYHYTVQ